MKYLGLSETEAGFTVVELLVAIIVGAIMVGSFNAILTSHAYISQRNRDLVIANAYAEGKIESIRSAGFLSLSNGTTTITDELPSELNNPRSATQVVSTFSTAVKKVVLSITYNEQGTARTYSYTTFVGELGVGQY